MNSSIRTAVRADRDTVVNTLHLAFTRGPLADWLVPDDELQRQTVFRTYADGLFRFAVSHGLIEMTGDGMAAAVWFPEPPTQPELKADDYAEVMAALLPGLGEAGDRFVALDTAVERHRPATAPFCELAFVGVHPNYQRRGIGTALIRHRLNDAAVPSFLVATNADNERLYTRLGFAPMGSPFAAAEGAPLVQGMWREPGHLPAADD